MNNKGYTLVEVIVSFSLIMIVMVYLLKTIVVISDKNNQLIIDQEYLVYENTLVDKIYKDFDSLNNSQTVSISTQENSIQFNDINKTLQFTDNAIIYDKTIYELPDKVTFSENKFDLDVIETNKKCYIITINLNVNKNNKEIKIVYQNN